MPYPTRPISSATSSVVPKPANGSKTICPFSVNLFTKNSSIFSDERTSSCRKRDGRIVLLPFVRCSQVCTASSGLIFRFALFECFNCCSNTPCPRLFTLCLRESPYFLTLLQHLDCFRNSILPRFFSFGFIDPRRIFPSMCVG